MGIKMSGDKASSSPRVKANGESAYMLCTGGCHEIRTTTSDSMAFFEGVFSGGVAKIDTDVTPRWAADAAVMDWNSGVGLAVTDGALYLVFYSTEETQIYGDEKSLCGMAVSPGMVVSQSPRKLMLKPEPANGFCNREEPASIDAGAHLLLTRTATCIRSASRGRNPPISTHWL